MFMFTQIMIRSSESHLLVALFYHQHLPPGNNQPWVHEIYQSLLELSVMLWTDIMENVIVAKLNTIDILVLRRWYIIIWIIIWENLIDVKWIHILLKCADVLEIFICILFVKLTFDKCENLYMLSFEYRLIIMKI